MKQYFSSVGFYECLDKIVKHVFSEQSSVIGRMVCCNTQLWWHDQNKESRHLVSENITFCRVFSPIRDGNLKFWNF